MKYEIINENIAHILNELFTEKDIENVLDLQFEDNTDYLVFSKDYPNKDFTYSCLNVYKKYFKRKPEYNSNEWNKFPDVEPPDVCNFYLVYKKYPETNNFKYTVDYWDPENKVFTENGNKYVVAFKEFKLFKE